jgi:hypothetical protein
MLEEVEGADEVEGTGVIVEFEFEDVGVLVGRGDTIISSVYRHSSTRRVETYFMSVILI